VSAADGHPRRQKGVLMDLLVAAVVASWAPDSSSVTSGHEPLADPQTNPRKPLGRVAPSRRMDLTPTAQPRRPLPSSTGGGVMLRTTRTPHPLANGVQPTAAHRLTAAADPPPARPERYRLLFEGDPTLRPPARPDWWLGPPGRGIPFGRHPASNDVARRRRVGDAT
jgi:hypothetical protein